MEPASKTKCAGCASEKKCVGKRINVNKQEKNKHEKNKHKKKKPSNGKPKKNVETDEELGEGVPS